MHLDHPITQCGQDVIPHHGMVGVDGVARPRIVLVVAFLVLQHVEDRVIHTAETEGWPQLVPFRRMIKYYVEDHFDVGGVEGPDHVLELQRLLPHTACTTVGTLGRTEGHGIIAPVVSEWLAGVRIETRQLVFVELKEGHQFHGRYPQFAEVRDLFHQAPVCAGVRHPGTGVDREAAHVRFINHSVRPRMPKRPVVLPVEVLVREDAFRHRASVIHC